ncbi:MAG: cytochrome c biogenesis protein ResB [Bacteroidales bacterium]|nr:cytochrome c biogenesis protein ResB [Bacteroidales bacterium]
MSDNNKKRKLFKFPWQYKEGFVISLLLIILGSILGLITKEPINFPGFPTNLSFVITYTLLLTAIYKFERNNKVVQWLSGIPAAVSSIILFTALSLILGIVPQVNTGVVLKDDIFFSLGLKHMATSWLLVFGYFFFMTSLGFATVKMFMPFKKKKLGILFSHLGLYIIIIAGIAGSGDAMRTYFSLEKDAIPTNIVRDFYSDKMYKTPFKLKLREFNIIEYNPKIVLVKSKNDSLIFPDNNKHFIAGDSLTGEFQEWKIKVVKYLKSSYPTDSLYSNFTEANYIGSLPSALVEIYNKNNELINKDWITAGNFVWYRKNIAVNDNYYFAMLKPEPKEFSSAVTAFLPDGTSENFIIKVNKPKTIMGWKIYQTGYDTTRGKWSNQSILEAGKDPWLPVVYSGIFLLIIGAFYLFWLGGTTIKNEDEITNKN